MAAAQTPPPRSRQRPKHHPPQPIHRPTSLCFHRRRIRGASASTSTSGQRRTQAAPAFAAVEESTATVTRPDTLRSAVYSPPIVYQPADAAKRAEGRPIAHKHRRNQPSRTGPTRHRLLHPRWCQWPTFLPVPTFLRCTFFYSLALPPADVEGEG